MKAVLFDMDGVLVLSEDSWFEAMNEIAQRLGCPPITRAVFDRGWGPERPIFGKVRYMNRAGVERKFSTGGYLRRWTSPSA